MNLDMIDSPVLILDALSDDYLFFNECDIAWDGQCHTFEGIQVNALKADELERIVCGIWDYDDIREFVLYFQNFLLQLESDDQIKVSRSMVAPGIRKALPEGDLTGITLANLAACAGAIRLEKTTVADLLKGTDGEKYDNVEAYTVFYDVRLANGIPCFFDLVARMLWDLRQCFRSLDGRGFAIAFFAVRNLDADQYFGDVDSPVAGAQENPLLMVVDSAPEISLVACSSESIEARVDGALDVENPGCDMANGVELFETLSAAGQSAALVSDAKPSYGPVGKVAKTVCQAGAQKVASAMSLVIAEKAYHEALDARDAAKYELKNAEKALEQRERLLPNFKAERAAYEKLKADIDEVEVDANKFADEVSFYQKQIEDLTAEINRVEGKLEAVTQEIAQTSAFSFGRRSALKSKQEVLQGELNAAKRKRKGIEDESHESSLCLMEDRAYLRENKEKLGDMERRIARMKEEIDKSVDEAGKMRMRVDEAKVAFEQADKAYEEARERYMNVAD